MSVSGQKIPLDLEHEWFGDNLATSPWSIMVYIFFFYMSQILMVVLLMRLLMAMLTATYHSINKDAVLKWRVQFVRFVMFAEFLWPDAFGSTWAGAKVDGVGWAYVLEKIPKERVAMMSESGLPALDAKSFRRKR